MSIRRDDEQAPELMGAAVRPDADHSHACAYTVSKLSSTDPPIAAGMSRYQRVRCFMPVSPHARAG